jgi:hypothetical protein
MNDEWINDMIDKWWIIMGKLWGNSHKMMGKWSENDRKTIWK